MSNDGNLTYINGVPVYQYTETDGNGNTYTVNRYPTPGQESTPTVNHKKGKKSSRTRVSHKDYIHDEA